MVQPTTRLNNFKRAIIDCDSVIRLDEKNLNAWLFRAKGYLGLGNTAEYEKCLTEARKNHPKEKFDEITSLISK